MPSEQALRIAQALEEAWSTGHLEALDSVIAPDCRLPGMPPEFAGGLPAYKELIILNRTAMPDWRTTITAILADGDLISLRQTTSGTLTGPLGPFMPTGRRFEAVSMTLLRLGPDGLVHELQDFNDTIRIMRQLGIPLS